MEKVFEFSESNLVILKNIFAEVEFIIKGKSKSVLVVLDEVGEDNPVVCSRHGDWISIDGNNNKNISKIRVISSYIKSLAVTGFKGILILDNMQDSDIDIQMAMDSIVQIGKVKNLTLRSPGTFYVDYIEGNLSIILYDDSNVIIEDGNIKNFHINKIGNGKFSFRGTTGNIILAGREMKVNVFN